MSFSPNMFPKAVKIDGEPVGINTDFRVCLKILKAFGDERLTVNEKLSVMITLLYTKPPANRTLAAAQGLKFLNMGKKTSEARVKAKKLYSFEKDAKYIYSAFRSAFGIDLTEVEYLHWWAFTSMFSDLGRDCFFTTLVGIRSRKNAGRLTEEEKMFVRKNADIVDLDDRYTSTAARDFIAKIGR